MSAKPLPPLIAVVEDEENLAAGMVFNLQAEGYRTHLESDGNTAIAWLLGTDEQPAAVLLDVMLPGRDGFSIVRELRERGHFTPVMMLTARGRSEDIVEGFAAGADDYLPKPFDLNVLFARLASLLRRMRWQVQPISLGVEPDIDDAPAEGTVLQIAGHTVDLDQLEIRGAGETIHLTLMEADLLRYLTDRPGRVVPRKELLENVWHVHEDTDTRAIDNFVVRLRRYLEPDPAHPTHLLTVRGVGYRFMLADQPESPAR